MSRQLALPLLFGSTLFVSAALLFCVQPMIAKMLLPLLGGASAVWNTCMVFFQAMLLAGYVYAHCTTTWLRAKPQMILHVLLLAGAAIVLPIEISQSTRDTFAQRANPVLLILRTLLITVGLPFFMLSASSAVLQKWFSSTAHVSAKDPYFLYAASNLGSLIALLSYPVLLEPNLRLRGQSLLWTGVYGVLIILTAGCVWVVCKAVPPGSLPEPAAVTPAEEDHRPTLNRRLKWIALAFVPSTLLLGITAYLSTDIAAIPLLWVIPLAIYLFTFILAFARREIVPFKWVHRVLPFGALGLAYLLLSEATEPVWLLISLHLLFFFLAALACHRRLADARPSAKYLTEFYLYLSLGGALGGIFNALIAPTIFNTVLEYPLGLLFASLLGIRARPSHDKDSSPRLDFALPLGIGILSAALAFVLLQSAPLPFQIRSGIIFGLPLVLVYMLVDRPLRFTLGLGALLLVSFFLPGQHGRVVYVGRNFFGVSRVTLDPSGRFYRLIHGNTIHGQRFLDPERQCEPLAYYHRTGPLGQLFNAFNAASSPRNVGVVGLGAGSMAAYSQTNQHWTYYEIDPAVIRIAQNANYFPFLTKCGSGNFDLVLGDARLRLRDASPSCYGLLAFDAFSSDAIPVHLLTREALQLYLSKLADNGILAFHISNRSLDLEPVLYNLAEDAGLISRVNDDANEDEADRANGKEPSQWVVMARRKSDLGKLLRDARWMTLRTHPARQVWTDDFSNLLSIFRWE